MNAYKLPKYTLEEYIDQEHKSGQKHEFHAGEIYDALAGGTLDHGLIGGNAYSALQNQLEKKGSSCFSLNSDVKLHIEASNSYVYPDTMVICGEIEKANEDTNAVVNPILIIEVLSKSTAEYDRGDKFYMYRKIPSFKEYVLIEQKKYVVDVHYRKNKEALWQIIRYEGKDQEVPLHSIGITISMEQLYKRTELSMSEK